MSARRLYALALVLGLLATGFLATAVYGADRGSAVMAAASSITGEELQEHVTFLADDAREGREAGTPGGKAAGDYLAEQFRRRGLRPAGDPGSYFQNFGSGYRNVLGCWEGGDPERAVEVILVGAHYDHIGYGAKRSRGQTGQVHNGADDNASGTSSLLELADALATLLPERPKRSILLAAWDAEEKGLLGSRHWVKSPTVPLEKVQIAINADMIGRLRQQRLAIYGTRSGFGLRRLLANANETVGLNLEFSWNVRSDSDHFAFFQQGIPALLLHTGMHADYHRPSDDPATLNPDGMQAVVRLMFFAVWELADRPGACTFREAARRESDQTRRALLASPYGRTGRLGVAWVQPAEPGLGVLLSAVEPGSPAEKAGLRPGDRIVEASGKPIGCPEDWIGAVLAAQGPLPLKVQRAEAQEPLVLSIELAGAPVRYGLIYRPDDAEPGAALVTCVVPGSAAALAGIQAGDYIHQIAGHPITDQRPFDELAASLPNPIELLVERDGKLLHLVLDPSGGKP